MVPETIVYDTITLILEHHGIPLSALSSAMGRHPSTITRNLKGNPTLATIQRVAQPLEVDIRFLVAPLAYVQASLDDHILVIPDTAPVRYYAPRSAQPKAARRVDMGGGPQKPVQVETRHPEPTASEPHQSPQGADATADPSSTPHLPEGVHPGPEPGTYVDDAGREVDRRGVSTQQQLDREALPGGITPCVPPADDTPPHLPDGWTMARDYPDHAYPRFVEQGWSWRAMVHHGYVVRQ